ITRTQEAPGLLLWAAGSIWLHKTPNVGGPRSYISEDHDSQTRQMLSTTKLIFGYSFDLDSDKEFLMRNSLLYFMAIGASVGSITACADDPSSGGPTESIALDGARVVRSTSGALTGPSSASRADIV